MNSAPLAGIDIDIVIQEAALKIDPTADLLDVIISETPGLLTVLPILYVAWADGELSPEELHSIRQKLQEKEWFSSKEKASIARWLDPDRPPSPQLLNAWLKVIRAHSDEIDPAVRRSLASWGIEIAQASAHTEAEHLADPKTQTALEEIESILGILSNEAVREILTDATALHRDEPFGESSLDVVAMNRLLEGEHHELMHDLFAILSRPEFQYPYDIKNDDYREKVLSWCQILAEKDYGKLSFPEAYGGKEDTAAFVTAFQTIAYHDLSLVVKFGVQFGLFGGSVYNLGSEHHHEKYLADIGSMALPGCFAMTEIGHGSNVRDIETTATYDADSDSFIIHTPHENARKAYIGNAAAHGEMATVFAQLEIGENNYGVHAFVVPTRDKKGMPLPGIQIEDHGHKLGLNGVDNGMISFDQIKIPRENLLDRFAQVNEDGIYHSEINSASKRFFTMLGTLVGGRVSIAAAALSAAKSALTIAVRYAGQRRQFGPAGAPETLLLDYPSHQRRLLPQIASAYALDFAVKKLVADYTANAAAPSREVETLAAALKAYSSWHARDVIQECRECCGGAGYMANNRFANLKADTEIFTTFEGDNMVLMQLVAKGRLTEYKHQFHNMKLFGLLKYVISQSGKKLAEMNALVTRMTDPEHLRDVDFQMGAFEFREHHLLVTVARRLKKRLDDGMDSYQAFMECQNHLINMAHASVEREILEAFIAGIASVEDEDLKRMLKTLRSLFALYRIERDKGWFMENGYIEEGKSKAIRKEVARLCREIQPDAINLVNAFGIPDSLLAAPIAMGTDA